MLPRSATVPSPTHARSQPAAHPHPRPPPPFYADQRAFDRPELPYRQHPPPPYDPRRFPYMPPRPGPPMGILADYRTFYPYQPNEVKHRRRTTHAQLKVLEGIFKTETKPNAVLRNRLAAQLEMTARGVQVWFQNRRAKEKLKASKASKAKAEQAAAPDKPDAASPPSPSTAPSSTAAPTPPPADDPKSDRSSATTPPSTPPSKPDSPPAPAAISPPTLAISAAPAPPSPWLPLDDAALLAQRRGSLPAYPRAAAGLPQDLLAVRHDPFARRRSVDASLQRLPYNPYSPVARARNSMLHPYRAPGPRPVCPPMARAMSMDARRFSVDVGAYARPAPALSYSRQHASMSSLPHASGATLPPPHSSRPSVPPGPLFAYSQRPVPASPIPGPLPVPGFSFGAPAPPAEAEQDSSPDVSLDAGPPSFDAGSRTSFDSASYAPSSRFGSLASIGTSDSQHTYYSDVTDPADYALRRASTTSTQFLGMMNGLDVSDQACYPRAQDAVFRQQQQQQQSQMQQQQQQQHPHPTQLQQQAAGEAYLSPTVSPKEGATTDGQRVSANGLVQQANASFEQQANASFEQQANASFEPPADQATCAPQDTGAYAEASAYPGSLYDTGISPSGHYIPAPAPFYDGYSMGYAGVGDADGVAEDMGRGAIDVNSRLEFAHPPDWATIPEVPTCDMGAFARY
ncbi:hypothetical protein HDZ31DRAFT_28952 [Schizophyllum fasciatum]